MTDIKTLLSNPHFARPVERINWKELFGNEHPLELELGAGRPHFLFERAKAVPEHNIVGIEWKVEWVKQAQKRKEREQVPNVHMVYGNAWQLTPVLFEPESLVNIVLNFPDPWWKKRHHKRRIINEDFAQILAEKLAPGGTFLLQTDVADIFDEYLAVLEANPHFENVAGKGNSYSQNPMNARSHREKKCEEMGIPIYRALLRKRRPIG